MAEPFSSRFSSRDFQTAAREYLRRRLPFTMSGIHSPAYSSSAWRKGSNSRSTSSCGSKVPFQVESEAVLPLQVVQRQRPSLDQHLHSLDSSFTSFTAAFMSARLLGLELAALVDEADPLHLHAAA